MLPNPEAIFDEANRFFTQYKQAARQLQERRTPEAALTMDLLARSLKGSPWLEIAVLKQSELIELSNDRFAMDNYDLLLQRVQRAPYFQSRAEKATLFGVALQGASRNGVNRIRARRIRDALDRYFVRYHEYPESLAKLAILGYVEMENIQTADNKPFRYVPTGQQLSPFLSYKRYEGLETIAAEAFLVAAPRLEGTSRASDEPLKYAALMRMSGQREPVRIVEDQNVGGYVVLAIAPKGVVLCNDQRIIVLLPSD
ncbi:MAG: hypothetical protein FJ395_11290 [Verrucomicrobia bacterium]|nr:hypothetical protein [Verrucomicrobiota bacterium]